MNIKTGHMKAVVGDGSVTLLMLLLFLRNNQTNVCMSESTMFLYGYV